jgi:hypothetical protein
MVAEIKKGVVMPPLRMPDACTNKKYPFADMDVGDCFDIPLMGEKVQRTCGLIDRTTRNVGRAASITGKRLGRKFSIRTIADEGVVRVWRVA